MKKVIFHCETTFNMYVQGEPSETKYPRKGETFTEYYLEGRLVAKSVKAKNGAFGAWIEKTLLDGHNLHFIATSPLLTHYRITSK